MVINYVFELSICLLSNYKIIYICNSNCMSILFHFEYCSELLAKRFFLFSLLFFPYILKLRVLRGT